MESVDRIEIIHPKPFEQKEQLEGSDIRKFGLFLISLKVIDIEKR